MNLKGFFKECHKKQVFKMLSIYIVSSWVILQVLAVIADPLNFPKKSVTYLIIILLIGFPIYIYYIWKYRLLKYEIQQTEDPNTPYNKSAFQRMYFSSLFVVGLLSGISIALIINNNFGNDFSLEEIQGNDKIAVLEFTNNTNDKNLDIIGEITANWIIHGITQKEVGQVITPKLVNDYASIVKSQAGTVNLTYLLKNYFKPGKVIMGGFYKEKDSLLLQGSIKNGLTDKTLISFETIACDPNSPIDCVEALKQKILGYLSIEGNDVNYYESTPPKFEALKYNQYALDNLDNDTLHLKFLDKAIKTDPHFFEPKIHKIAYFYNKGQYKIADSLRLLIGNKSKLSVRQNNIMLFYESILKGKNDRAYAAHKEEYKKSYKDLPTNMTDMTIALQYVNRPEDIDAIYKEINMDDLILENCTRCGFRYYLKGLADVELGNYNKVIKALVPVTNIIEDNYLKRPLISAYVKSGKLLELENYLSDYALTASTESIDYLTNFIGIQLINANYTEDANTYFNKIITRKDPEPSKINLAQAYYFKGDYINAQKTYKKLHLQNPNKIEYLVHFAISNFNNGNFEAAKTLIEKLNSLRTDYQYGAVDYGWAQYYAAIGDKDKAIEFLHKSVAQGYNYTPATFQNDPHFKTIKNNPEFINRIMNYWKNKTI
jgi:tetratricopeptide (TPR) repeat protein